MTLFKSSGGDFYKVENGTYVGEFRGVKLGPVLATKKEAEDGTSRMVDEQKLLWLFALSAINGTPIIDPKTGEQAIGEGMTSQAYGAGRGNEATARKWARAMVASKGLVFTDAMAASDDAFQETVQSLIGTKALLTFGRSANGRDGTLRDVAPAISIPAAAAPVTADRLPF